MEIPEISMLSDFEAGMKCLQNPSLISRFFSLSGIEKAPQVYSFWKWGALLIALLAVFSGIINRIKLFIIWVRTLKPLGSVSEPLLQHLSDDFDWSEEDDTCSVASSEDDEEYDSTPLFEDRKPRDEDLRVAGSSSYYEERGQYGNLKLRQRRSNSADRFSWSDFTTGKRVVKLWDSFGLGLDVEDDSGSEFSVWDLDRDQKVSSFFSGSCQIPAVAILSPAVVLSAEVKNNDSVVLGAYDTRVGRRIPAVYSEWRSRQAKVVGINPGGVEKVYVRDGVTGALTVGDMRNVKTSLDNVTVIRGGTLTPLLSRTSSLTTRGKQFSVE